MNKNKKVLENYYQANNISNLFNTKTEIKTNNLSPNVKYWIKHFIKLILQLLLIVFVVYTIAFIILYFIPGEPYLLSEAKQKADPATIAELEMLYGVDNPFFTQYFSSLGSIFNGTFGYSWQTGEEVSAIILPAIGLTLQIAIWAILIAFFVGIPLGVFLGKRKGVAIEWSSAIIGVIAFGIPTFVIGLIAMLILSAVGMPIIFEYGNPFVIIICGLIIGIVLAFTYARYLKTSVSQEYSEQYVSFAKTKGLSEQKILWTHTLKPSLFPIATFIPAMFSIAILGSVTLETIFGIPGSGSLFADSAINQDRTVLLGIIFFYTIFIVVGYFLRDLCYMWIDPKLRT